jgi:hypothetical protein
VSIRLWAQLSVFPVCLIGVAQHGELAWTGGHGTEPYEQKTQQSPAFGFKTVPQPVHS